MRRAISLLTASLALSVFALAPVGAHETAASSTDTTDVVREIVAADAPDPGADIIGTSRLTRTSDGLRAKVNVHSLEPGGVYTFWWVVPQEFNDDGPVIPGGVFVAYGASSIVGGNGKAVVTLRAFTGQAGIEGFPPLGGAQWKSLDDPLDSIVRIEIAYHGQVADAGADLRAWKSDFWTGAACPQPGSTNLAGQPHCPVYLAATHLP